MSGFSVGLGTSVPKETHKEEQGSEEIAETSILAFAILGRSEFVNSIPNLELSIPR